MKSLKQLAILFSLAGILSTSLVAQDETKSSDEETKSAATSDAEAKKSADDKKSEPAKTDKGDDPKFIAPDDAKAKAAADAKTKEEEKVADPVEEWSKLKTRRSEIFHELQSLKKDFEAAEGDEQKREIVSDYRTLIAEFEIDIYPKMLALAKAVHEKKPDDVFAAELVLSDLYNKNKYDESLALAEKMMKDGSNSKLIRNIAGCANFAVHNFERAKEILKKCEEDGVLDSRNLKSAMYLGYVDEYIKLWKAEQAVREREAKLEGDKALPRVELDTNQGKVVLELFENEAPNTVANFISLVESGYYDATTFHRVIRGFMAQGGDVNSKDEDPTNDGFGGPGYKIKCECQDEGARMHFRGSISMAHSGKDTGGSQFFLTHLPTPHLNPDANAHTVFGRIIEGQSIVEDLKKGDKIQKAKVLRKRNHDYKPVKVADDASE